MTLKVAPPIKPFFVKHPKRMTILNEAKRIIEINKANKEDVTSQINTYFEDGFLDDYGLYQNGFFVADKGYLLELVFAQVERYTHRDQLALPYCLWKSQQKIDTITAKKASTFIKISKHK